MEISQNVIDMRDGLTKTLGITYHSTPDPNTVEAHLLCTEKCSQPWGYLSGGATLALAENLAGVGSMCLVHDKMVFGINISASHVKSVKLGESVIATARLQHAGRTLHQWHVEVKDVKGDIVSTIQVTNFIR